MNDHGHEDLLAGVLVGDVRRDDPRVLETAAADREFAAALERLTGLADRLDRLGEQARQEASLPVDPRDAELVRHALDGRRRRRRWWFAAAAACVAVVVGIASLDRDRRAELPVDVRDVTLGGEADLVPGPEHAFDGTFTSRALHRDTYRVTIRVLGADRGELLDETSLPVARLPWRPEPALVATWPDRIRWVLEQVDAGGNPLTAPVAATVRLR